MPSVDLWTIFLNIAEWFLGTVLDTLPAHQSLGIAGTLDTLIGQGPLIIVSMVGQIINLELWALLIVARLTNRVIYFFYSTGRLVKNILFFWK